MASLFEYARASELRHHAFPRLHRLVARVRREIAVPLSRSIAPVAKEHLTVIQRNPPGVDQEDRAPA
jgi:hypothetical protein